jgi:ribonuclease P protein component
LEYLKNKRYFFPKKEKLCSKKIIDQLFMSNNSFFSFPFKVLYFKGKHKLVSEPQVLISVSKKKFSKSHDRNRIKRLIRETYRKNKYFPVDCETNDLKIAFIYTHKEILVFSEMDKRMKVLLSKLNEITQNYK